MIDMLRFDPFFRDVDRLTQQLWGSALGTVGRPAVMPMDAWRDEDKFVVEFDVPGIKSESLDVSVENQLLTVRAERPEPGDNRNWLVAERPHGVFSRQVYLDASLDTDKITADYTGGVLRLTIPVAEAAKPRKIAIDSGANQAIGA
ncbi:MAG TPA: Hsp20/alpha crystallin family protein [Mycobacterium sp.]|nr:Hsp20/alpha crystallin family protein [Mycobacterium sp.]